MSNGALIAELKKAKVRLSGVSIEREMDHAVIDHATASIFEAIKALEQSEWVKCGDGYPEAGQRVVVVRRNGSWDRSEYAPIYFDGVGAWYLPEGPTLTKDVLYWKPITPPHRGNQHE